MSGGKDFKGHLASFMLWIYSWWKKITSSIFNATDKNLSDGDGLSRQWFRKWSGDRKSLEKLIKNILIGLAICFFAVTAILKIPKGKNEYSNVRSETSGIIPPSRGLEENKEKSLDLVTLDLDANLPPLEVEEAPKVNLVDKLLSGTLEDFEKEELDRQLQENKIPGTRLENLKRASLLDDRTPEYLRKIIRDNLTYGDDGTLTNLIADASVSPDKVKRKAADIVANPESDRDLANFLTEYLRNRLSGDQESILELLRMDLADSDRVLRDAAIVLAASGDESKISDSDKIVEFLRRRNEQSRAAAMEALGRHYPGLKDMYFNAQYPPNRILEMAKIIGDELNSERGKLNRAGYPNEEGIFGRVLGQEKIDLGEYDKLKNASRATRDQNKIYDSLFDGTRLPNNINVKGNEEAIARLALSVDDPEIRGILEKLLRGEDLTPEEIAKLKAYLAEHDPELFIKLFGKHAYDMYRIGQLLNNKDIQEGLGNAIDLARSLGFYREAELLDRLRAGEDLTAEELEEVARFLEENDPELFKKLFQDVEFYVDSTGRRLTRAEIEALEKIRAGREKAKSIERVMFLGDKKDFAAYASQSSIIGEERLFTADQSFRAMLNTHIVLSDKETSISYRFQLTLYDDMITRKGQLVAPKGSIITGVINSSGVNFDTKIMNMNVTTVSVHDRDIPLNMIVGSGDGAMGVRGQVWDHKERKFVGMLVTSFGAGISDVASKIVARDFTVSENTITIPTAMPSVLLGGVTETLNKISEQIGQDLQNAPRFFQVPSGTPVVLFPGGL